MIGFIFSQEFNLFISFEFDFLKEDRLQFNLSFVYFQKLSIQQFFLSMLKLNCCFLSLVIYFICDSQIVPSAQMILDFV